MYCLCCCIDYSDWDGSWYRNRCFPLSVVLSMFRFVISIIAGCCWFNFFLSLALNPSVLYYCLQVDFIFIVCLLFVLFSRVVRYRLCYTFIVSKFDTLPNLFHLFLYYCYSNAFSSCSYHCCRLSAIGSV